VRPNRRIGPQRDCLAVEDQLLAGHGAQCSDDFGRRSGHVVAIAREDADIVMPLVNLHPRAVELPLEGRGPERAQRIGDTV
jgi:hypothetical protein